MGNDQERDWNSVIGRALAYLCMVQGGLLPKDLATKGKFLEGVGLTRQEAADLLGTTYGSLSELYRQAGKKAGGKRRGKGK